MGISFSKSPVIITLVTTTDNKKSHRAKFGRNEQCFLRVDYSYNALHLYLSREA